MKRSGLYLPDWSRRLWFRLGLMFFTLSTVCMAVLVVLSSLMASSIYNWRAFHARVNTTYVERLLQDQEQLILRPLRDTGSTHWPARMAEQLAAVLTRLEGRDEYGLDYSIDQSSDPVAEVMIADPQGNRVLYFATRSSPVFAPDAVAVHHVVSGADGEPLGRVSVRLDATFDRWLDARNALTWVVRVWLIFVACSALMGLFFGLFAARYVTSRLRVMNLVTEEWRRGRFGARIDLGSDDELTIHSRRLNRMAQDLELLISLKQSVATGDERNRVARELHDTVKQKLFALSLQIEVVKSKPAAMAAASEHIQEAEAITREAQSDLMEIITQLRPSANGERSLREHVAAIAEDFARRFGVRIECARMETGPCSPDTEHHVVRIVQEALMNAVQHGRATAIDIAARVDYGATVLTIKDNGSGFDPDAESDGFGLVSMRDRADDLPNGRFSLESQAGAGTRITLSWVNEP